ncbi:MAG: carbon storage regulator [Anaerolineae bacterium]|jgi:carbon storage regulator|nr:MAG: carbon storage regulator [Anaerolineae bacterium]
MLVLTRKAEESLVIGDQITLTILAIEGDRVKIGIQAPREIRIYRKEVWDAIHEQNRLAELLAQDGHGERFKELRQFLADELDANKEVLLPSKESQES